MEHLMQILPFLWHGKTTIYWSKILYHLKYEVHGDDKFPFICTCLFRALHGKILQ